MLTFFLDIFLCSDTLLGAFPTVLMLDEATASIDRDTDRLIQSMIRDSFEGVTTMVIAHRLNTIMDFDRILVFDEGRVVEFDTVSENILQLCTNTFCPLLSNCF